MGLLSKSMITLINDFIMNTNIYIGRPVKIEIYLIKDKVDMLFLNVLGGIFI